MASLTFLSYQDHQKKLSLLAAAMGINETLHALFVDCFLLEKDLFKFLGKFLSTSEKMVLQKNSREGMHLFGNKKIIHKTLLLNIYRFLLVRAQFQFEVSNISTLT